MNIYRPLELYFALGTETLSDTEAAETALRQCCAPYNHQHILETFRVSPVLPGLLPVPEEEMLKKAQRRALEAIKTSKWAQASCYGIGVDRGVVCKGGSWFEIAVIAIQEQQREGMDWVRSWQLSTSVPYFIPAWIVARVRNEGRDISAIVEEISGNEMSDPVEWFSNRVLTRTLVLEQAIKSAFASFMCTHRYDCPQNRIVS